LEIDVVDLALHGRVDDIVRFGVQTRIALVQDRRELDESLGHVGLLAAADRDDRELAQQRFPMLVRPPRDA
jgi:hypothetical protein